MTPLAMRPTTRRYRAPRNEAEGFWRLSPMTRTSGGNDSAAAASLSYSDISALGL